MSYQKQKEMEEAARITKTTVPISEDNVGFQMLKSMGFEYGMSLGKNNNGIRNPIDIKARKKGAALKEGEGEIFERKKRKILLQNAPKTVVPEGVSIWKLEQDVKRAREVFRRLSEEEYNPKVFTLEHNFVGELFMHMQQKFSKKSGSHYKVARLFKFKQPIVKQTHTGGPQSRTYFTEITVELPEGTFSEKAGNKNKKVSKQEAAYKICKLLREKKLKNDIITKQEDTVRINRATAFSASALQKEMDDTVEDMRNRFNYCLWCGMKYSNFDELVDKCAGESEQAHILRRAEEKRKEQERKRKEEEARLKEERKRNEEEARLKEEKKRKEEEARLKELERKSKEKEEEVRLKKQKDQEARSKKEKKHKGFITKPKLKMKPMLNLHAELDQKNCSGKEIWRLNNTVKLTMKPLLNENKIAITQVLEQVNELLEESKLAVTTAASTGGPETNQKKAATASQTKKASKLFFGPAILAPDNGYAR